MRHHPRALRTATLTAAGLVLAATAACGGGEDDDSAGSGDTGIDGVEVSGDVGSAPTVEIASPVSLEESQTAVLVTGDGEELASDSQVQLQFALYNGADGEQIQSSYEQGPQTVALDVEGGLEYLVDALVGRTVGSRLLVGVAPSDGFGEQANASGAPFGPEDTLLYVVDVLDLVPTAAEGEEVADVPEGLPTVTTGDGDAVTGVEVPGGEPPAEIVVQPLIEGEGDPLTADDTIMAHYTGVLWDGGETFDSSWDRGEPASFPLTGVIPCWTEGLAGQAVGSRVLLVCPPDQAYGPEGQPPAIPADATLVFVVDILAA
ncbi:MAG: FKBP-type peptidyl-prolyl cis-trans isomerase [Kineosporiaceae bacterium]